MPGPKWALRAGNTAFFTLIEPVKIVGKAALENQLPVTEGPKVFVEAADESENGYGSEEAIFNSARLNQPGTFFAELETRTFPNSSTGSARRNSHYFES